MIPASGIYTHIRACSRSSLAVWKKVWPLSLHRTIVPSAACGWDVGRPELLGVGPWSRMLPSGHRGACERMSVSSLPACHLKKREGGWPWSCEALHQQPFATFCHFGFCNLKNSQLGECHTLWCAWAVPIYACCPMVTANRFSLPSHEYPCE